MAIHYVRQDNIDITRWDKCISSAFNGSVYAMSWYLDIVAEHWDALVEDDYQSIMPLIYRQRNFVREIYAPLLSGQQGVFSAMPVGADKITQYFSSIPRKFRKVHMLLNRQNSSLLRNRTDKARSVFELDLIMPYEKLAKSFSPHAVQMIEHFKVENFWVMKHLAFRDIEYFLKLNSFQSNDDYGSVLSKIITRLIKSNKAEISGVYNNKNTLCAIACYVKSHNNVLLIYASVDGMVADKDIGYLLVDDFLRTYSSRNVTLSFEFQDEVFNKEFYQGFGALETYAYGYYYDKRPFFLKWL